MAEHLHFVTGRLAEKALRRTVAPLATQASFDYSVEALPITVAALMTTGWIARRIQAPKAATKVIIPGYCQGDLKPIVDEAKTPVERGPRDLRRLPTFLGQTATQSDYGGYDIEIVAEINHCPRKTLVEIVECAKRLHAEGADVIDLGCEPGHVWLGVSDAVRALRDQELRVSVDSFQIKEIAEATSAGAELVLSVNRTNRDAAGDWGCEVVAIPDEPEHCKGLDDTIHHLNRMGVPMRLDPILEPIGYGFAVSLERYFTLRRRYPDAEMLMGIGNLTEMTEVDSAGVNVLLLAICQELGVRSALTTQVIPWARTCIQECHQARRMVHYAVNQRIAPKHLDSGLVTLRDEQVTELSDHDLNELAKAIRDPNFRLFVARNEIHLIGVGQHWRDVDPVALWRKILEASSCGILPKPVDAAHAFYLGYELAKAETALILGKQYEQDEPLDWGFVNKKEPTQ